MPTEAESQKYEALTAKILESVSDAEKGGTGFSERLAALATATAVEAALAGFPVDGFRKVMDAAYLTAAISVAVDTMEAAVQSHAEKSHG